MLLALTLARDEVLWLMKHMLTPPPKGKHRHNPDDYVDVALPELLFFILEIKSECFASITGCMCLSSSSSSSSHLLFPLLPPVASLLSLPQL